ncbi:SP_1767 family glycosyltransferase [uncultured Proteiniphilum sp.]|uniref:SP_1767 family glycosyltransferase n=1 Tax=uncultured Proteiniphilum sp. TaxID=497637 RepID=UPI00262BFD53|nr:SP_1767 family glycosyltransferase [uncultured Proteiniphilum sp.]
MKYSMKTIADKVNYNLIVEFYNMLYLLLRKKQRIIPTIFSIEESIEKIIADRYSVSRFGDGEMLLIGKKPIRFQQQSDMLSRRLIEVIQSQNENHLVCISDSFQGLERYTRRARRFWRTHFYLYGTLWDTYLVPGRSYYNTFITRPYIDFKSKTVSTRWFNLLKRIWNQRSIIFIEGEKSRLGVGNDLFDNASSIQRILCPPINAYDKYDAILEKALEQNKNVLFLIALGPTATVLAYDLYQAGYQAIDIGHVDIEYEWFRMGATHKVSVPSKYVNEALTGKEIALTTEEDYHRQIICSI